MVDFLIFKPTEDPISYDLGWIIQNEKVSDEELCRFLLNETSFEIERLVSRFLKSPADQIGAVDQIIFTLLLKRRSYKGNTSGRAWLNQLIVEECLKRVAQSLLNRGIGIKQVIKAIETRIEGESHLNQYLDTLSAEQRLIVFLHYGQNLTLEEIALLMKIDLESVRANFEQSLQNLTTHQRSCEECSLLNSNLNSLESALFVAYQSNSQLIETALINTTDWATSLLSRLDREKMRRRTRKWVSRAAEICLVVVILVIGEWSFTNSWPNLPWAIQPSESSVNQIASIKSSPEPLPTTTPLPPVAQVSPDWEMEKILSLTLTSWARWKTLWADVQVKTYKVENFSDGTASIPDQNLRKQIWLSIPGSARVMSGPSSGNPDISYSVAQNMLTGQNFDEGQTMEHPTSDVITDLELRKLFSPVDIFSPGGKYTNNGSEIVARRPAWVLDWFNNGRKVFRYWVDQDYGVILRRLEFGDGLFQPVISDITVTNIYFDASFQNDIFEPFHYRGNYFAHDFSGDPEINDYKSALQNWSTSNIKLDYPAIAPSDKEDFASARLSFINVPAGWKQQPIGPGLELFADSHDLGRLPLDGKSIQTCVRSPDGRRIAYNSPPNDSSGDTALFIADLGSIQNARPALMEGITAGDFAFSPDNKRLAFFGCEKSSDFCGIFIMDLTSSKLTSLTPLSYADYMIWSPDGHSLALVGKDDFTEAREKLTSKNLLANEVMALLQAWNFQIIDTNSGYVTYKRFFDWPNLSAPADSPTNNWDRAFKVPTAGVKGCVNPPGETNIIPN